MTFKQKIGIVQNAPLTADFSHNLRQIVQGYRECIDHGADLVVAPATALCGALPKDLTKRRSFIQQTQAALKVLADELGEVPLILGAYSYIFPVDEDDFPDIVGDSSHTDLTPYLLENSSVTELDEAEVVDIDGLSVYVDLSDTEVLPTYDEMQLIIHLRTAPWYAGKAAIEEEDCQWEAKDNEVPVVSVHAVGCADGHIYGGGSALYSADGRTVCRLPFMESGAKVVSIKAKTRANALPEEAQQLCSALELGIRDTVRNNGYSGVSLNMDTPNAALLAALSIEALGRNNVVGMTTTKNSELAKKLGINYLEINAEGLIKEAGQLSNENTVELAARITASVQYTLSEARGLMYLCPLNRRDLLLGEFTLYGDSCGHFAPLGNLYEMDLHMLRRLLQEKYANVFGVLAEPQEAATDRILHELADKNLSATELLNEHVCPFEENEVRFIQRKLIASALKRSQIPMVLHADKPEEQIELPITHRMND